MKALHFFAVFAALAFAQSCTYKAEPYSDAEEEKPPRKLSLPEQCRQYYNDGSGRWAKCMGVGPK